MREPERDALRSSTAPRSRSPSSYQSTARPAEAHAVLAPALGGFSPTSEMPEIAEAQALLAALAETEEVEPVEAQQRDCTCKRPMAKP